MKILFLGDVVGPAGCNAINFFLPNIVKKNQIDFVIVNGENAANEGVGITENIANDFFQSGVNVISEWIGQTDEDYTDGQLAVIYALKKLKCNYIIIYGGFPTSFDVDHFLGNLKLMRLGFHISIIPSSFRAEMRDVFQAIYFVSSQLEINRKSEKSQYISLIAEHRNVHVKSSTGLRWDVSNMWIDPDQPKKLRNEFISDANKVMIELAEGSAPVYVIHNW